MGPLYQTNENYIRDVLLLLPAFALGVFASRLSLAYKSGDQSKIDRLQERREVYSLIALAYALIPPGMCLWILKCVLDHNGSQTSF